MNINHRLLIMQFSWASCYFLPLIRRYLPQHCALNALSLYASLHVRDRYSHHIKQQAEFCIFIIPSCVNWTDYKTKCVSQAAVFQDPTTAMQSSLLVLGLESLIYWKWCSCRSLFHPPQGVWISCKIRWTPTWELLDPVPYQFLVMNVLSYAMWWCL